MLSVYRVCVYISLMTSGEPVRLYSMSDVQRCYERQYESCLPHIRTIFSDKQNYLLFGYNSHLLLFKCNLH